MAAAAVKLPLTIKKGLKDAEPEFKKELSEIEAAVGFPVTYNFSAENMYTATEGHKSHDQLAQAATAYLKSLKTGIQRECKDAMVKAQLASVWTTKNITLTCEPDSFVGADYMKTHVAFWDGYCGIRFVNGDLDIYTKKDRYNQNIDHVGKTDFVKLFANVQGDLPLSIRKELRDKAAQTKAVTDRIAKALGVDAVKCDWEGDAKAVLPHQPKMKHVFTLEHSIKYLTSLAALLEKEAKDDMVKEAIVDAFGAKTVSFKVYENMNGIKGLETHDSYHGVQFLDGHLTVFTQESNFGSNIDKVEKEHKLVKLF